MKKLTKFLAAAIAVCTLTIGFTVAGCAGGNGGLELGGGTGSYIAKNTGTEIVFTATTDVLKEKDSYSLLDYMTALYQKKQLAFCGYDGEYGYYITSVNGIAETSSASAGSYWAVYISFTTLEGDDAVYAGGDYSTEYDYEGVTLYSANYGASGIPYVNGATYALIYSSWSL